MRSGSRRSLGIIVVLVLAIGIFVWWHKKSSVAPAGDGSGAPDAAASSDPGNGSSGDAADGGASSDGASPSAGGKHHHRHGAGAAGADGATASAGAPDASASADGAAAADAGDAGGGKGKHGGRNSAAIPPVPVQAQAVKNGNVAATVAITGNINALHDIQVAAKATAKVVMVPFYEGDYVHAGQVLVQQDTTDLEANVRADVAQIHSDEAKLEQAQETYKIELTQAKQNVLNSQAAVNAANQAYLKLFRGNRPQDILQAEAATLQAKATLENSQGIYDRDKVLFPQGAIPKQQWDTDAATNDANNAAYKKALAAEEEEKIGYQQEDINSAHEALREQQANLKNAIANQRQIAIDKGAIDSAKAVLAQDHAKMAYDQTQVGYAVIRAPVDGIVAARETEPGEMATSGTALVRIVNLDMLYYEPTISETDFEATHNGDNVKVTVDALPGQVFPGHVQAVFPAADTTTRVFTLRVLVENKAHKMRPGMFARGTLVTKVAKNVPIIPTSALVTANAQVGFEANNSSDAPVSEGMSLPAQDVVVLRPDGKSVEVRPVTLGIVTMQKAQVLSGLAVGDQIVVVGQQGLKTGDKVTVNTHSNSTGAAPTQVANQQ